MVFSSILFLFRYLAATLAVYFVVPKAYKNGVLFFFSLLFYAWGEPIYVVLLLFSTLVDYRLGMIVERSKKENNLKRARRAVVISACINLGLLGFFKYSGFLMETLVSLTHLPLPVPDVALPIGISFYTFQTMSYTIDIYRGEATVQKHFIDFGAYVSLFPQLIAGPIVRYQTVAEELRDRHVTWNDFGEGARRFVLGLGKKVLLANPMGQLWEQTSAMTGQASVASSWLGILAFGLQIYFDFSGYSDMAIGLGRMLGFHFLENFNYPYISKSATEFWRRWHISLGTWFREYVYIPLGGNRRHAVRNLFVVWLLTGLWHGASFNFLLWGLFYGILLFLEKKVYKRYLDRAPAFLQHAYLLLITLVGWVLFAFPVLSEGIAYLGQMFGFAGLPFVNATAGYLFSSNGLLLLIAIVGCTPLPAMVGRKLEQWCKGEKAALVYQAVILLLSVAYLVDASYNPFLYFRF